MKAKAKSKKKQVKSKGGRPSKYDPKYCAEIIKYFTQVAYKEVITKIITKKNGDVIECCGIRANDPKFINGFAKSIKVAVPTLHEWADKHEEFSNALAEAKRLQEIHIIINALQGTFSASFAKFAMKNMFGWRDKELFISVDESTHYTHVIQQLHDIQKSKTHNKSRIAQELEDLNVGGDSDTDQDGSDASRHSLTVIE